MNIQMTKEEFAELVAKCTRNTKIHSGGCYVCILADGNAQGELDCNLSNLVERCEIVKEG